MNGVLSNYSLVKESLTELFNLAVKPLIGKSEDARAVVLLREGKWISAHAETLSETLSLIERVSEFVVSQLHEDETFLKALKYSKGDDDSKRSFESKISTSDNSSESVEEFQKRIRDELKIVVDLEKNIKSWM